MSKGKYYKILGLSENASSSEIRKRYRILAMKYHPDKNSHPNAENIFIQLTEAYEILLNKRKAPDETIIKSKTGRSKEQDREERVKNARQRYAEQVIKERIENERYFRYLTQGRKWKTIKVAAIVGLMLSVLLIADMFLPHHYEEDKVIEYRRNVGFGPNGHRINLIKTEKGNYYWLGRMSHSIYGKSRGVFIESSWIFHNPIRVLSKDKTRIDQFGLHFTLYYTWPLIILIFLVPVYTMQYKRKSVGFTLLYHLSYFGSTLAILLFLITNHRWAHLLTFGFF